MIFDERDLHMHMMGADDEDVESILIENAKNNVWLTQDGRELNISDMSTSHIRSTLSVIGGDQFIADLYKDKFKRELERR
jgi:hypothetical protein